MANLRLPQEIRGDLTAMSSAIRMGEGRLRALIERHGIEDVRTCLGELIERSERQMRSHIEEIPDGTYTATDYLDNDGLVDEPIEVSRRDHGRRQRHVDRLHGHEPGGPRARQPGPQLDRVGVLRRAQAHLPRRPDQRRDVPSRQGARPARDAALGASTPRRRAATWSRSAASSTSCSARSRRRSPSCVPAAPFGTTGVVTVGGLHPEKGAYYVGVFPYPGGYGASAETDGLVHGNTPQSMANFVALEASEHRYPVHFEYFALRENSSGAGAHRGGSGSTYRIATDAQCVLSVLGDRADHPPFGLHGGGPAAPNRVRVIIGGEEWEPPMRTKLARRTLEAGDAVIVASPGGGGYGDPLTREVEAVQRDLNLGYISREIAERDHAVVVAEVTEIAGRPRYRLDAEKTTEARRARTEKTSPVGAVDERGSTDVGS